MVIMWRSLKAVSYWFLFDDLKITVVFLPDMPYSMDEAVVALPPYSAMVLGSGGCVGFR